MIQKTFKAFTLVELLIVIVIIGILMSALLPRLQGAQDIARDTSRQVQLAQLETAIVAAHSLNGKWPGPTGTTGVNAKTLSNDLVPNILSDIPKDPNNSNLMHFMVSNKNDNTTPVIGGTTDFTGNFLYLVRTKNNIDRGGIVLVAKTETAGKSNWVQKSGASNINEGLLPWDIKNIQTCDKVSIDTTLAENTINIADKKNCKAQNQSQLFYLLRY